MPQISGRDDRRDPRVPFQELLRVADFVEETYQRRIADAAMHLKNLDAWRNVEPYR